MFGLCLAEAAAGCSESTEKTSSKQYKRRRFRGHGRRRDGAGNFFVDVAGAVVDIQKIIAVCAAGKPEGSAGIAWDEDAEGIVEAWVGQIGDSRIDAMVRRIYSGRPDVREIKSSEMR